jgi:hypothetical protein
MLIYVPPSHIERNIATEQDYRELHYAIYCCSPDDQGGINQRRTELSIKYPDKIVPCGQYFILTGVAAAEALTAFYYSVHLEDSLPEELRDYYFNRYQTVKEMHEKSQSLPVPIDLTERQFATDKRMELYVTEAIQFRLVRTK